tara:strand:+ start:14246 stop:15352 length:1107 start_codon:yes stop_codon:yes gene_type:complete
MERLSWSLQAMWARENQTTNQRSPSPTSPTPKVPSTLNLQRLHRSILTFLLLSVLTNSAPAQKLFIEDTAMSPAVIENMYVKGMRFLAETQAPEGYWNDSYGRQPGVVGLAVVALLAHGDDPNHGAYSKTIHSGLKFVLSQQNKETGYIGTTMYNHGFATLALAEAYGAVEMDGLGRALEKAISLITTSQKLNPKGAWRYSPESKDADTTVSGAQMVALFAARNAGLYVSDEAIETGLKYFKTCKTPDGGYGYTGAASPNATRTAIASLVMALAKKKSTADYKSAMTFLRQAPVENHYYHYFLYYASQAYFHSSPADWRKWNIANITALGQTQARDGRWEGPFGASFCTSASLLSLALNYRYLPIYER